MLLQSLLQDPVRGAIIIVLLLVSLGLHEWGHAWVADRLGDPTPRSQGRVTINPIRHLDPFGSLLLLIVGFGYAKPVLIDPRRFNRWGDLAVSAAGIVINLLIAAAAVATLRFAPLGPDATMVLLYVSVINIALAVFNLLPIPPLDGSHILTNLAPGSLRDWLRAYQAQSWWMILVVFVFMREPLGQLIGAAQGWVLAWAHL